MRKPNMAKTVVAAIACTIAVFGIMFDRRLTGNPGRLYLRI